MRGPRFAVRRAAEFIVVIDLPEGQPIPKGKNMRAFKLKHARAKNVANILVSLLDSEASILPLSQTNRLIVAGPEAAIKEAADLIEQLDVK